MKSTAFFMLVDIWIDTDFKPVIVNECCFFSFQICVTKMSTRNCQGMDSVIKPLDTIPEDKKVRVQRTQSSFDPFEKPANQVKRVHSENNACINFKTSSAGKESPKVRRHSSPSSVSAQFWHLHVVELITPEKGFLS